MPYVVDVVVPTLNRRDNPPALAESLFNTAEGRAQLWFVVEDNDQEQLNICRQTGAGVIVHSGTFPQKVNFAWSYLHYTGVCTPWFMPAGDDVVFSPGWLDAALQYAADTRCAVVGTNDLANRDVVAGYHATHPLISRSYIIEHGASWDGPGVVCHEGYHHCYVDNEWTQVAKDRGVFGVALSSIVEHMHPISGKVIDDGSYAYAYSKMREDAQLYAQRERQYSTMYAK
jgi:glycosyltransferase involved in cell wall biosynthesis